jgi:iron complex outermembrane receptor protein
LLCLFAVFIVSGAGAVVEIGPGGHAAWAQPAPSDTPSDTPTDTPTENPPPPPSPDASPAPADAKPAGQTPPTPAADTVTITGTIRSPDLEAPLAGATVTVDGTQITAISDEQGRFTLSAPPGQITLHADFSGFRPIQKQITVAAGKSADVDLPLALDQLLTEVVVVVGSRTPRTNLETTAPVDIVTAEEISHVGKTETGRILSTLAPSFISTPQTVADGTDHVDPASLRGLGPDQTLVLINGKRRHKSALLNVNGTFGRGTVGTDLNAIPAGSIKRIEILRDGAASQYGSDAIAGVINIVTKDYTDLLDMTALTGITGSGDGGQIKTSANYGFKIGKRGFLNITGEFLKKDPTNRAGRYTGAVYTADPALDDQIIAMNGLTRDSFKMRIGEAGAEDGMGSYNMELPIDDVSTFYSFGDLSHRSGNAAGFYRYPNQTTQNVASFYPNGFLPEIHSNINDLGVTIGVRRKGDWNVDASLTHGQNSFQFNVENSVNASLGTSSPTSFDAGTLSAQETLADLDLLRKIETTAVKSLAFVVGSEVRIENYKITAGDVASYTFGGLKTNDMPPKVTAPGAQVFPGFQPSNEVDRTRNNVGVYTGLESEVVKGVNVDVGGRYENYSDFGNSFTGKAAARVPLSKEIALRGAVSTGFRAPSLQQLWFSNVSSLFIANNMTGILEPNQVLTSNNASPITGREGFGIPKLKQETSKNVSTGVTLRPLENLSVTADGYFIRLKNRIVLTNQFTSNVGGMRYAPVADILDQFPGVTAAQFFANAVDTDTLGLDVVGDYAIHTGGSGTVLLSAAANFTKTEVKDVHVPSSLLARFPESESGQLTTFFFDRLAKNRLEDAVPHQKGNLSARYNFNQLSALLRANYYGRVRFKPDIRVTPGPTPESPPQIVDDTETFGAKVLFDADVGYQFTKNLQLTVGGDNLLNTFPDKNTKANNISFGRFIYNRNVSQFGWNGGFYYAKLELTFF